MRFRELRFIGDRYIEHHDIRLHRQTQLASVVHLHRVAGRPEIRWIAPSSVKV
jgi:hypothetical protein